MKAAWLEAVGRPLRLVEHPEPRASAAGVVVSVLAVRVPSYTRQVLDGTLGYDLPTPLVPGPTCIGRVESVGGDVFDIRPGQTVLCNSLLSSADTIGSSDDILVGWTGSGTTRSRSMQQAWRDGSFAEKAHYPARCLTPLPGAESVDVRRLPFLASLAIADGALKRGALRGGQSVVINGATGQLGGAAVLLALARGAGRVIATGRDHSKLESLAGRSPRVIPCKLSGERDTDAARLRELAEGGTDLALDYLGQTPTANATLSAIDALKAGGTAVLVGGVRHDLALPYQTIMRRQLSIRGSFMFQRDTALECWMLMRSGAVDLSPLTPEAFPLGRIEDAIAAAPTLSGFNFAVLLPNG